MGQNGRESSGALLPDYPFGPPATGAGTVPLSPRFGGNRADPSTCMRRLLHLLRRRRFDREIQEEMRLHMDLRVARLRRVGMPLDEAEAQARRTFGNVLLLREEAREMWGWSRLELVFRDMKFSLRQLRRNPAFT